MIEYLSNQKLEDVLTDELTIVDFFANWCSPCKMIGMELEELPNKIIKVDVDTHGELAQSHGIMSIPTIEIYKNKKMVTHFIGFKTKDEKERCILKEIEYVGKYMNERAVTSTLFSDVPIPFEVGDYIDYRDEVFSLRR